MLNTQNRYQVLDAFRGFAALVVVLFHFTYVTDTKWVNAFNFGVTGVDFFFIISGFVIFISINASKSASEFLKKRFLRLFPAYICAVVLTSICLVVLNPAILNSNYILTSVINLTMFQNYFGFADLDASYWTLRVEWIFYICIALALKTKLVKQIPNLILLILPLLLLWDFAVSKYTWNVFVFVNDKLPLFAHLPLFCMGIIFYELMQNRNIKTNWFVIVILSIIQVFYFDNGGKAKDILSLTQYAMPLIAYILLFILFIKQKLNFLKQKWLIALGTLSYPIYLVQQRLAIAITTNIKAYFNNTVLLLIVHLCIITIAAIMVYKLSEMLRKQVTKKWIKI